MWISSCHMLSLSSASHGRGLITAPSGATSNPTGPFIQPLTAITLNEPAKPDSTTGMPVRKCARLDRRSQP